MWVKQCHKLSPRWYIYVYHFQSWVAYDVLLPALITHPEWWWDIHPDHVLITKAVDRTLSPVTGSRHVVSMGKWKKQLENPWEKERNSWFSHGKMNKNSYSPVSSNAGKSTIEFNDLLNLHGSVIFRRPCWMTGRKVKNSYHQIVPLYLVGGLEHVYFPFHMGCHPSHWLSYFSRWLKPPTRYSHGVCSSYHGHHANDGYVDMTMWKIAINCKI